jgi:hypothetical protein
MTDGIPLPLPRASLDSHQDNQSSTTAKIGDSHADQASSLSPRLGEECSIKSSEKTRKETPGGLSFGERKWWHLDSVLAIHTAASTWWWWEIAAAMLSAASMGATVIVLAIWDDTPLREWTMSIQPNSLIATLGTISKTAMLVIIAESISQLKWLHYD